MFINGIALDSDVSDETSEEGIAMNEVVLGNAFIFIILNPSFIYFFIRQI